VPVRSRSVCARWRGARVGLSVARIWSKDAPFGTEFAEVTIADTTLTASGVAIGSQPCAYRLDYTLETTEHFVTRHLAVQARGRGWRRGLVLERSAAGVWLCTTESEGDLDWPPPGGEMAPVADALDCDLGLSPLTNTMPVLRHHLLGGGGPFDLLMAWVAVPELTVTASPQRYTFVRRDPGVAIVRYQSLDSDFLSDITFDEHGLVLDYPGIGRAVA
jgi:uncharacterized protein